MKKKTRKQELFARPHVLLLVFYWFYLQDHKIKVLNDFMVRSHLVSVTLLPSLNVIETVTVKIE